MRFGPWLNCPTVPLAFGQKRTKCAGPAGFMSSSAQSRRGRCRSPLWEVGEAADQGSQAIGTGVSARFSQPRHPSSCQGSGARSGVACRWGCVRATDFTKFRARAGSKGEGRLPGVVGASSAVRRLSAVAGGEGRLEPVSAERIVIRQEARGRFCRSRSWAMGAIHDPAVALTLAYARRQRGGLAGLAARRSKYATGISLAQCRERDLREGRH